MCIRDSIIPNRIDIYFTTDEVTEKGVYISNVLVLRQKNLGITCCKKTAYYREPRFMHLLNDTSMYATYFQHNAGDGKITVAKRYINIEEGVDIIFILYSV